MFKSNLRPVRSILPVTLFLSTVVWLNTAYGQSVPTAGHLYGESIVSSTDPVQTTNPEEDHYVSTPTTIYINEMTFVFSTYTTFYKAPEGKTIKHIDYKSREQSAGVNVIDALIVQFNDGTVLYINLDTYNPGDIVEVDNSALSSEWIKAIGDAVYALSTAHVYVSRDSTHHTWNVDSTGLNGAHVSDIALDSSQNVYAATNSGLFVQNSDSNVWNKVASLTQSAFLYNVFVDRKDRILISGNGAAVCLSTDDGSTWSVDSSGIGYVGPAAMTDDAFGNLYIASNNPFHVFKSAGGTSPWQTCDTSITRIAGNGVFINSISGDSVLIAGTNFGVFISTDQGQTWTSNNDGIISESIYGIAKTRSGVTLLSNSLGIYSNTPPDTTWTKTYPQNGFEGNLPLYHDEIGNIYTVDGTVDNNEYSASSVVISTNGGVTWTPDTAGLSSLTGNLFYVDRSGTEHYCSTKYGSSWKSMLWEKPNGGSWTIDTTGFPVQNYSYSSSMTSDDQGYLYVSGYFNGQRVMRRPLAGGTWVVDTVGIPTSVNYFTRMSGNRGTVVGTTGTSLYYRSSTSWNSIPPPAQLSLPNLSAVCVDDSGVVFAAFKNYSNTGLGVYFTRDSGSTWTYVGLDSNSVTSLVSFGDSTYALTSDAGAFYLGKNPLPTGIKKRTDEANSFHLSQNYPNPFNPSTVIRYQLSANSRVTLKIYDVLGREVGTLVDGQQPQGEHEVTFNALRLASGVYFYRIEAVGKDGKNFDSTKKLVFVK